MARVPQRTVASVQDMDYINVQVCSLFLLAYGVKN